MALYKVIATPSLRVRAEPNLSADVVSSFYPDTEVEITNTEKDDVGTTWGEHELGWSAISAPDGTIYMELISGAPETTETPVQTIEESAQSAFINTADVIQVSNRVSTSYNVLANSSFTLESARSIMGLPAQFMEMTDPAVPGSNFGRIFTENILMDMPLCTIIPGGPKFLTGKKVTQETRSGMLAVLLEGLENMASNVLGDITDKLLDGDVARYYSFESQYPEYMEYVNSLNRVLSQYLGIQDVKGINDTPYKNLDWKNINIKESKGIQDFIGSQGSISFYYDRSGTSSGESGSNMTDRSMLDGILQGASSAAKEAAFLTQAFAGQKPLTFGADASQIDALTGKLTNASGMMDEIMTNLKSGFTTVATGSNLLLPEIWKDSSFSRSYSLQFRFTSPYGTPEAYFLNIGVPMNFLLPLVLPRQFGPNGYGSPFLVQVFAQGLFNCSLGIVDGLQISKFGSGDAVSREYLPLEVVVSISFKDLYSSLSLSNDKNTAMFANNIELIDYIATMAGVNLNVPDIQRKINIFVESKMNTIRDVPGNIKAKLMNQVRNGLMKLIQY